MFLDMEPDKFIGTTIDFEACFECPKPPKPAIQLPDEEFAQLGLVLPIQSSTAFFKHLKVSISLIGFGFEFVQALENYH